MLKPCKSNPGCSEGALRQDLLLQLHQKPQEILCALPQRIRTGVTAQGELQQQTRSCTVSRASHQTSLRHPGPALWLTWHHSSIKTRHQCHRCSWPTGLATTVTDSFQLSGEVCQAKHSEQLHLKNTLQKQPNTPVYTTNSQEAAPVSPSSAPRPKSKSQSSALTKRNHYPYLV